MTKPAPETVPAFFSRAHLLQNALMKQNMVKLRWLVVGLAGCVLIMMAASLFITDKITDHSADAEKTKSQPSPLADSLNSTDLRSSAPTVPNNKATHHSSMDAEGAAHAGSLGPENSLLGHSSAKSSYQRSLNKQSEQKVFSEVSADLLQSTLISTGSSPANRELAVTVPPGEQAPAVFYDNEPRTEPQMLIIDEIARDFNEAIQREVPGYTAEDVWSEARDWADERYMLFFGEEALNKLHLQAAQEAVAEKEAMGQLPQRTYE